MTLPNFFIIGAMKAGTTTLDACLRRHPSIFMCPNKEPQFFSRDHVYAKGFAWYESLFDAAGEGQGVGESSTCYSRSPVYPDAAARIAEHAPGARFVYVLRHPAERFHSHYGHRVREMVVRDGVSDGDVPSLDRCIEEDEEAFCAGLYDQQIEKYGALFPADRVRAILFEDLRADPRGVLAGVQAFVGVDVVDLTDGGELPRYNERASTSRRGFAGRMLAGARRSSAMRPVRAVLPTSMKRRGSELYFNVLLESPITSSLSRRLERLIEPLTPDRRALLVDRYRESVDRLEARLGRALPEWKR